MQSRFYFVPCTASVHNEICSGSFTFLCNFSTTSFAVHFIFITNLHHLAYKLLKSIKITIFFYELLPVNEL
jgi:hypothetical protein